MTERYICIHGHFYQPPRENPWLEAIEVQDSAYPHHDWNARVHAECYRTNASARILDGAGGIVDIINTYARISFNFGPTLLSWMEHADPEVYRAIRKADVLSRARFSGHGSALAQAYNHIILPLANHRDRVTQVRWGIADFAHRFGRAPEGMWLPETAVDLDTLEVLADHGLKFTILAPHQAGRVRPLGDGPWHDVTGGRVDPTRPYLQRLPSGREIALFFYDGPVSRAVAFEKLLGSGERFARRIADIFDAEREGPQLAHIATDGETYGHHHRHGEMALAYALAHIEDTGLARLTNYGEYLERHPPTDEVQVLEDTSWSCAHGVERWRSDCGCSTGGPEHWSQAWRTPLREALDWLRDAVSPGYEAEAGRLFADPWAARDAYVDVVLDRAPERLARFLEAQAGRPLDAGERVRALELLELQRHAMLMYTSCGWFFTDLAGIETVQVLQYAGRVVQLAEHLFGARYEAAFLERLQGARSNVEAQGSGRDIYERAVVPARVDLRQVAVHWALSSLFDLDGARERVYCYRAESQDYHEAEAGRAHLALGKVGVVSEITGEQGHFAFGALHFGDHNLTAGVGTLDDDHAYDRMVEEVTEAFRRADLAEALRRLDRHFGERPFGLRSLFRDEQRAILDRLLDTSLGDADTANRRLYRTYAPLMRFVDGLGAPVPGVLRASAAYVINRDLREAVEAEEVDADEVRRLMAEARDFDLEVDAAGVAFALTSALESLAEPLTAAPVDRRSLERLDARVALQPILGFEVDLWRIQNVVWQLLQEVYPTRRRQAHAGDEEAGAWVAGFERLAAALSIRVLPPDQG